MDKVIDSKDKDNEDIRMKDSLVTLVVVNSLMSLLLPRLYLVILFTIELDCLYYLSLQAKCALKP